MALRIEITGEDRFTPDKAMTDKIVDIAMSGDLDANGKKVGLVLDIGGYWKNVITLAPALTISTAEMDWRSICSTRLFTRATRQGR